MPLQQRLIILSSASILMLVIFELVRRRRLREEYAWLWLLAGALIWIAALIPFEGLRSFARLFGSENPPAAIFFLGFLAVTLLCLQFSVRLSRMTEQVKNLGQQVALLEEGLQRALERSAKPVEAEPVEAKPVEAKPVEAEQGGRSEGDLAGSEGDPRSGGSS